MYFHEKYFEQNLFGLEGAYLFYFKCDRKDDKRTTKQRKEKISQNVQNNPKRTDGAFTAHWTASGN